MKLIASSPTVITPCCVPYRYVIMLLTPEEDGKHEFVVWDEYFREDNPTKHSGYGQGSYYMVKGDYKLSFAKAFTEWYKRVGQTHGYTTINPQAVRLVT